MRIIFFLLAVTLHLVLLAVNVEHGGRHVDEYLIGVALVEHHWHPSVIGNGHKQPNHGLTTADAVPPEYTEYSESDIDPDALVNEKERVVTVSVEDVEPRSSVDIRPVIAGEDSAAPDLKQLPDSEEEKPQTPPVTPVYSGKQSWVEDEAQPNSAVPAQEYAQPAGLPDALTVAGEGEMPTGSDPHEVQGPTYEQARPRYGHNPEPVYPTMAIRRGWEGTVEFDVKVLASGLVDEVRLKNTSGYGSLDRAARTAILSWRFYPATSNGRETESWVVVPVQFVLDDRLRRR